jgi:aerobic-type carbon monoxide dehydrogenase small subunit (CoxS/CutS family)
MTPVEVELTVNGEAHRLRTEPSRTLLAVLREDLLLTGTKPGCGEGRCGACTVLLDGEPVVACLLPVCLAARATITTVEGLDGPEAERLRRTFAETGAIQCGICTPGMLVSATALLRRRPRPGPDEVRQALVGNLCRCTGYQAIVEAVLAAAAPEVDG